MAASSPSIELSIVIPCYNEAGNVEAMWQAVTHEAEQHARSHEIIFIDNGSHDGTRDLLHEICARDGRVRAIFNNRNYGQMRSPTYGIYQAEGAAVIGMCCDFQDPPALIGPMLKQWQAGAQIVLGQRKTESSSWGLRTSRSIAYGFLSRFADYPGVPDATGFGLYDREVVDMLASWNEPEPFMRGMAVESGYRLALIAYDRPPRAAGESKNGFWSLLHFALSGLAASGKSLLRLPLVLSIYISLLAFGLLVATIIRLAIHGYSPVMILLTAQIGIFAILLFLLGLIGDQVRLLAERSRNTPLVVEEQRLNFPDDRQLPAERTITRAHLPGQP